MRGRLAIERRGVRLERGARLGGAQRDEEPPVLASERPEPEAESLVPARRRSSFFGAAANDRFVVPRRVSRGSREYPQPLPRRLHGGSVPLPLPRVAHLAHAPVRPVRVRDGDVQGDAPRAELAAPQAFQHLLGAAPQGAAVVRAAMARLQALVQGEDAGGAVGRRRRVRGGFDPRKGREGVDGGDELFVGEEELLRVLRHRAVGVSREVGRGASAGGSERGDDDHALGLALAPGRIGDALQAELARVRRELGGGGDVVEGVAELRGVPEEREPVGVAIARAANVGRLGTIPAGDLPRARAPGAIAPARARHGAGRGSARERERATLGRADRSITI